MTTHSQTGSFDLSALNNLNQNLTQYFWFEEGGSGSYPWGLGAHVTLYPQSEFTNPNDSNYLKGQNILINTDGFSLRNGTIPLMVVDNDSLDFNLITNLSQGTYVNVATFGATGATIGQLGAAHSVIDANGQRFYGGSDGTERLANIGYGETQGESGAIDSPFYTFGVRGGSTASDYDPTATYSVGEFCVYNDVLYICVQSITTPEAWNVAKWRRAIGSYSLAEGYGTVANGYYSHAEGQNSKSSGRYSHAEGDSTIASGNGSHAEGYNSEAGGNYSHAEGYNSEASGSYSHAEGQNTEASSYASHAEGYNSKAMGRDSHAEGASTIASGDDSHAEGYNSEASGGYSHAEGYNSKAIGYNSHAQNIGTKASSFAQTAIGQYNVAYTNNTYAFIIGNGTSDSARSNALTVDWNGGVNQIARTTILENKPAELKLSVHQTNNNVTSSGFIRVYDDHDASADGTNMVIQSGGNMVIGSGESAQAYYNANLTGSNGEYLYLTSDQSIHFFTDVNGSSFGATLNQTGVFYPRTNGTGQIGSSEYRWGAGFFDAINSTNLIASGWAFKGYGTNDSTSIEIPITSTTRGFLMLSGAGANGRGIIAYSANTAGTVTSTKLVGASTVTVTNGTNKITLTNSSGAYLGILKIGT